MVVGRDDNFNAGLLTDLYQLPAINYQLKGTQAMNTKRNLQDDLCGREARCRRERRAEVSAPTPSGLSVLPPDHLRVLPTGPQGVLPGGGVGVVPVHPLRVLPRGVAEVLPSDPKVVVPKSTTFRRRFSSCGKSAAASAPGEKKGKRENEQEQ